MLSLEETLLLKAAQAEKEKQEATKLAGGLGAAGGAVLGAAAGSIPHALGRAVNKLRPGRSINTLKPGFRMAGGLTGAILGGALGAGTAAVMKQENPAAQILAKIQATGEISPFDEQQLINILADSYKKPSELM